MGALGSVESSKVERWRGVQGVEVESAKCAGVEMEAKVWRWRAMCGG